MPRNTITSLKYHGWQRKASHYDVLDKFTIEPMRRFLAPWARQSAVYDFDDFLGDTIDGNRYTLTKDSGATDFVVPGTLVVDGVIQGVTGTGDNDGLSIHRPGIYKGDNNCGMEIRFKLSAVTDVSFEIGFIDANSDKTESVVLDVDTPSTQGGVADMAVVHMDTDQTLQTMAFVTDGSTSGYNATKTNISTLAPTADTYMTVAIQFNGDLTFCMINNDPAYTVSHGTATASKVEGGTLLIPWVYVRTRSTVSKTMTIDYWATWQDRS